MPSFDFNQPLGWVLLWSAVGSVATIPYASFFEHLLHSRVMHTRTWLEFPWKLHAVSHHGLFGFDETFHALDDNMRSHITFVPRDYLLLTVVNAPVYALAEWLCGRPIFFGCIVATLAYLQAFNSLHWRFHVPSERWPQRSGWFLWLKEHHRLHHRSHDQNLNVVVPLADWTLGTLDTKGEKAVCPDPPARVSSLP